MFGIDLHAGPEGAKKLFFYVQLALALGIVCFIYFATRKSSQSSFKVREADKKSSPPRPTPWKKDPLAGAKIKRPETPKLSGIRIDGEPHEVLGVQKDASAAQIQAAYRDLMKRYHPDIVGRPGSREWTDAQKIAEAINTARSRMLADHSQSPNRSGR
jgi:hypothetical protein